MLVDGLHHVAVLTKDTDRFHRFYQEVFDAEIGPERIERPGYLLTFVDIGAHTEVNLFELDGNAEADRQTPMFGRGRLDHLALWASSRESFDTIRDRLVACGASDGTITDFGPILSVFFRDPDGLEGEVCCVNGSATPGTRRELRGRFGGPGGEEPTNEG